MPVRQASTLPPRLRAPSSLETACAPLYKLFVAPVSLQVACELCVFCEADVVWSLLAAVRLQGDWELAGCL